MYKITFTGKALDEIDKYSKSYKNYYKKLYEDSWIWAEKQIKDAYVKESIFRYDEIVENISLKLSASIVTYPNNQAIIRWRSKILLVSFKDRWDTRTITDLKIR